MRKKIDPVLRDEDLASVSNNATEGWRLEVQLASTGRLARSWLVEYILYL